jgi:hypothetical protein
MPAEPAIIRATVSYLGTAGRAAVAAAAVVSALFCLAVSVLLLINQSRLVQHDPLNATVLTDLRLRFIEAPQDESLKQAIRIEDSRARQSYFAYRERAGTGVWLLLGGALTLIASLAAWSLLRDDQPDISTLEPERAEWDRRQAAWRGLAVGAVLLLAGVVAGFAWRVAPDTLRILTAPYESPTPPPEPQPLSPEP